MSATTSAEHDEHHEYPARPVSSCSRPVGRKDLQPVLEILPLLMPAYVPIARGRDPAPPPAPADVTETRRGGRAAGAVIAAGGCDEGPARRPPKRA